MQDNIPVAPALEEISYSTLQKNVINTNSTSYTTIKSYTIPTTALKIIAYAACSCTRNGQTSYVQILYNGVQKAAVSVAGGAAFPKQDSTINHATCIIEPDGGNKLLDCKAKKSSTSGDCEMAAGIMWTY